MSRSPESNSSALERLVGMVRSPRTTLAAAIAHPRTIDMAALVVVVSAACSVAFLETRVGRLAALDQQVRQLESFGLVVSDSSYAQLRGWLGYRPLISAAAIVVGWPLMWLAAAAAVRAVGNRVFRVRATFAQVLTVIVHSSAVLAVRALVAAPINYARESLGGATSLSIVLPSFVDGSFAARLFGALDVFVLWWVVLAAIGLGMVYHVRAAGIARWLLGAYATAAAVLALTQALRGGV